MSNGSMSVEGSLHSQRRGNQTACEKRRCTLSLGSVFHHDLLFRLSLLRKSKSERSEFQSIAATPCPLIDHQCGGLSLKTDKTI